MRTEIIDLKEANGAHFISDEVLVRNEQDALDLLGEVDAQTIILHTHNFDPDFFDLSTRKLGDVLQKFTNYGIRMAVIGDFSVYPSVILPQFIAESNRHKQYIFVSSLEEVERIWGQ